MTQPTAATPPPRAALQRALLVAAVLGAAIIVLLAVFEYIGIEGTEWLWNGLLHADENRWLALPIAIIGGLALTAACLLIRVPRVPEINHDVAGEFAAEPPRPGALAGILLVGAVSLLAGASLGPEATLMAAASTLAAFAAHRYGAAGYAGAIVVAAIGALLVGFLGSPILLAVALVVLWRAERANGRRPGAGAVAIVLLAGLVAWGAGWLLDRLTGHGGAYGAVPQLPSVRLRDFVFAIVVGLLAALLGKALNGLTALCSALALGVMARTGAAGPWLVGLGAGAVLGGLYAVADPSVRFTGGVGSTELASKAASLTPVALIGIVVVKIVVTAWSKGTGYRGGMVFPAIYTGLAFGLLLGHLPGQLGGAGMLVGAIGGLLASVIGGPLLGGIVLIAVLPPRLWLLALAAIAGTYLADALLGWVRSRRARATGSATHR